MRSFAFVCAVGLALSFGLASAPPAGAQSATIAQLQARLQADGDRLDRATEAYDQAKIRRESLDAKLNTAQADLARSQAKLASEEGKLGAAARNLYMHPAAGLGTFFQAKSYGQLERGSAFAGKVFLSTDALILHVRRARAEEQASESELKALRDQARNDEERIANERTSAAAALQDTQGLLSAANGELARFIETQRQAGLASAGAMAAKEIKFAGSVSPGARAAVSFAAAQEGKPYEWGGAGPATYDCSGLTMRAWGAGGVSLPHSSEEQQAMLPSVPLSQLAPGDLVFVGYPAHHVGIYAGNGRVIHAPHTGTVVQEVSLWSFGATSAGRP
jgi:cell wall-associated NlpC family hydrolase